MLKMLTDTFCIGEHFLPTQETSGKSVLNTFERTDAVVSVFIRHDGF